MRQRATDRIRAWGVAIDESELIGIDDLVSLVMHSLRTPFPPGATVNVGNPNNTVSIVELAQRIRTRLGSTSGITYVDPRTIYGSQYRDAESFDKLCELSTATLGGWTPLQSLDDVIDQTATFFRHSRAAPLKGSPNVTASTRSSA